ncbi:hypothetical protein PRNP1_015052 [Phytophthora ramorum]
MSLLQLAILAEVLAVHGIELGLLRRVTVNFLGVLAFELRFEKIVELLGILAFELGDDKIVESLGVLAFERGLRHGLATPKQFVQFFNEPIGRSLFRIA